MMMTEFLVRLKVSARQRALSSADTRCVQVISWRSPKFTVRAGPRPPGLAPGDAATPDASTDVGEPMAPGTWRHEGHGQRGSPPGPASFRQHLRCDQRAQCEHPSHEFLQSRRLPFPYGRLSSSS